MTTLDVYSTPEKWAEIAHHPYYQAVREQLERAGEEFLASPIPPLSFQAWTDYKKTGSRASYESAYFNRRGRLAAFALLARLTGEQRWFTALEETIWAVCGEFAWAVPAHLAQLEDAAEMPGEIDLFSAETAFALGETDALLGDRLSPSIRQRIRTEARRRVIAPFLAGRRRWRWEEWENNWVAVCACGITHALVYLGEPGELENAMDRLLAYARRFLNGFPADGACLEGSSYWLYGFGFFAQMAETLHLHTGGAVDLLSWDKAEEIAAFPQKTCLCGKWSLMLSDANDMEFIHDAGLTHMLSRRFPAVSLLPDALGRPIGMDECYRFGTLLRNLLWTVPTEPTAFTPSDAVFPQAQWHIANRETYACVVKGGHNDEPHNHNDVGHVSLVSKETGYLLWDLGAGAYTADYFAPATRYTKLNTASRGHSVPLVNGREQLTGREYSGCLTSGVNAAAVEFARAYGQPDLLRLERSVQFLETGVTLTDHYEFAAPPARLRERFVTGIPPQRTARGLAVGGALLMWDDTLWEAALSQEDYPDHFGVPRRAYFMDFIPRQLNLHMRFTLQIEMGRRPKEE